MVLPFVVADQVKPSVDVANLFSPGFPNPPTIHLVPAQVTLNAENENNVFPFVDPDHVIPSDEYANAFVPCPAATHCEPLCDIP
jgi:hypothetical protein